LLDHPAVVGAATLGRENPQTHAWLYPWHRSDAELSLLVRGRLGRVRGWFAVGPPPAFYGTRSLRLSEPKDCRAVLSFCMSALGLACGSCRPGGGFGLEFWRSLFLLECCAVTA
jgi:hypothetical protein